jgi:MtN3 and saliva related transmembrane protein
MDFSIFDDRVSPTMNFFLVIGNIINLGYNIPQMMKTYKTKSTKDFSSIFLFLRVVGNSIWIAYSIELNTFLFLLSNIVTVASSVFICYYKVFEIYNLHKPRKPNTDIEALDDIGEDDDEYMIKPEGENSV